MWLQKGMRKLSLERNSSSVVDKGSKVITGPLRPLPWAQSMTVLGFWAENSSCVSASDRGDHVRRAVGYRLTLEPGRKDTEDTGETVLQGSAEAQQMRNVPELPRFPRLSNWLCRTSVFHTCFSTVTLLWQETRGRRNPCVEDILESGYTIAFICSMSNYALVLASISTDNLRKFASSLLTLSQHYNSVGPSLSSLVCF